MEIGAFSKTYEGRRVLDFPGGELKPGEIWAVIGANGSGKSTFARILAGQVKSDGRRSPFPGGGKIRVGYLPQKPYPFRMTVRNNLFLGAGDRKGREEKAEELLQAVDLKALEKAGARTLSGGETARMALARLMMKPCDLLILDEPTAAMDVEATLRAEELMRRYAEETSCAMVLITHSLRQAERIAHKVMYFQKGTLIERGDARQVLKQPARNETRAFLEFYGA